MAVPVVLHVTTSSDMAGTETAIARLLAHSGRYRHTLVALEGGGALLAHARDAGWPAWQVCDKRRFRWRDMPRLWRILRQQPSEVVQSYLPATNLACVLLHPFIGDRRLIAGQRFGEAEYAGKPLKRALLAWSLRRADRVASNSRAASQWLVRLGVPETRVATVPNGLNLAQFDLAEREATRQVLRADWDVPNDACLFVMLARFAPPKDHAGVLEALARCNADRVRVAFCGRGPDAEAIERLAGALGVRQRVRFPGHEQAARAFAAADVALLWSRSEGMPNALLEAMAMGRPCVASACGGVAEAVDHERTGLVLPTGDTDGLAEAMRQLADDAERRKTMGQAGRVSIERHFTVEAMVARYEALWDEVLADPRRSGWESS